MTDVATAERSAVIGSWPKEENECVSPWSRDAVAASTIRLKPSVENAASARTMIAEDDLYEFAISLADLQPQLRALGQRYKAAETEPEFVRRSIQNEFYPLVFIDVIDAYREARRDVFANATPVVTRAVANRLCAHFSAVRPEQP